MNSYITGGIIKRLREEKGLTQSELGSKLGVSDKTVSKWETGKGYPDITLIEPIAELLNVSVFELISGEAVKNSNENFNMKKSKFYVCPVCNNVIFSSGEAVVCCHGIPLFPEEAESCDQNHGIKIETVEDEYYVTVNHEMSKEHYISFIAAVTDDTVIFKKLYPESEAQARFKKNAVNTVYCYCNRHGLYQVKPPENIKNEYSKEAKARWGETAAYKESQKKFENKTETAKNSVNDGLMWIFAKFGKIKNESPESDKAKALVKELKNYISDNYYTCTDQILKGLGEMYVNDERFKKNIDSSSGEGTAAFVNEAIKRFN